MYIYIYFHIGEGYGDLPYSYDCSPYVLCSKDERGLGFFKFLQGDHWYYILSLLLKIMVH